MNIITDEININTKGFGDIIDITENIEKKIASTGFKEGNALVFCPGATSGISTVEYESGLVRDLNDMFEILAPEKKEYFHNLKWNDGNGRSHLLSTLFKTSVTVPFYEKKLILGTWQQIIFIEFDVRKRNRKIVLQLIGV